MQVTHVLLRVSDMERATAFYRDAVGLTVLSDSPAFTFLDAGTIRIALNAVQDPSPDLSSTEIVFEVDDVAATHAEMAKRGVPFEVDPRPVMADGSRVLHAAHFRDPDGHLMSITGWVSN